jgi:hypothetical protein
LQWAKIVAESHKLWQVLPFAIMSLLLPTVAENRVEKAYGTSFSAIAIAPVVATKQNVSLHISCIDQITLKKKKSQIWRSNQCLIVYNNLLYH